MKKLSIKPSLLIMSLLGSCMSLSAWANEGQKTMLKCSIEAPASVKAAAKIPLKFKLTNDAKHKLMVLKWNTPLEGWFGSSFNVTRDGKWVNYTGAMVKRFRPSEEDYATLNPGQSIEQTVNMAEGYDIKSPGNYKLVFNGRLQDVQVIDNNQALSSKRKLHSLSCNELTITVLKP